MCVSYKFEKVVSEADRIKAVERVRVAIAPIFGGTPSFKRKRGIYRALKRGDANIEDHYKYEIRQIEMVDMWMNEMFYVR